ncbi:MAG: NnrS family protein [Bryobacterales bacterium]|nr:NnrS family protein [Bryobacterales bacterium]
MQDIEAIKQHEAALQRSVTVWIVTGLLFMLLPGTFLGAWNLISISDEHGAAHVDPAWIQAHGHAQIFGWIGAFILGIGFYSLSKMRGMAPFAISRAWTSWVLWTAGVGLRWATNLWRWHWRLTLPVSAILELAAFILFFLTVRGHRSEKGPGGAGVQISRTWIGIVVAGTLGFLLSLLANLAAALHSAFYGAGPAVAPGLDARLLALFTWAFPVVTIWGFSARWLPTFLGLSNPDDRLLKTAVVINTAAVLCALGAWWLPATALFAAGAITASAGLHIFARPERPPKIVGVHATFPLFVRIAYVWLVASACISLSAALWDRAGGLWGASRHALTVGFISTMVFAIGQRVLPAFCGMRVLFSPRLMFAALAFLNIGCFLRVGSEIGAYEGYLPALWSVLPFSAIIEMTAMTLFAVNLFLTFGQVPPHLRSQQKAAEVG